jgi:hypothetical protein
LEWLEQMAEKSKSADGFQWFPIQVSARVLQWPNQCACCGGPSNTHLAVTYTRAEGVKVIRTDTKTWETPYCQSCLDHMQAAEAACEAARTASAIDTTAWDLIVVGIVVVLALALVAGAIPAFLLKDSAPTVGTVLGILLGLGTAVAVGWLWHLWRQRQIQSRLADIQKAQTESETAFSGYRALLRPGCCPFGPAVAYDGWHGTLHSFRFYNHQYADSFAECNASKIR